MDKTRATTTTTTTAANDDTNNNNNSGTQNNDTPAHSHVQAIHTSLTATATNNNSQNNGNGKNNGKNKSTTHLGNDGVLRAFAPDGTVLAHHALSPDEIAVEVDMQLHACRLYLANYPNGWARAGGAEEPPSSTEGTHEIQQRPSSHETQQQTSQGQQTSKAIEARLKALVEQRVDGREVPLEKRQDPDMSVLPPAVVKWREENQERERRRGARREKRKQEGREEEEDSEDSESEEEGSGWGAPPSTPWRA
ncbi:hypothetical protein L228DRAFT_250288 [Xylona heveae TC161]|uniref:Uncharacterized protein n=1 Tax=Xylona heveae (strain CBS 132557 / TC161) TaxID=1328760 RepID=A0A165A2K5_XYLHT|nr:hypothetical protein L228DRAFT_250288 [Xylona heveae TC161]KZF19866.1 hypothetical protein L228DRAFT_250288 [Xylona heveae TC161]